MALMPDNVYDYFTRAFGVEPQDTSLRELPVGSPCGADCKRVIDAASLYLQIADTHLEVKQPLVKSVNAAVEIFWRG